MIVNLGSKKGDKNDDYSPEINHSKNKLLIRIVDIPGNALSHSERK